MKKVTGKQNSVVTKIKKYFFNQEAEHNNPMNATSQGRQMTTEEYLEYVKYYKSAIRWRS
ncbi:MAG: hypothetical protein MI922_11795 [Bacteroidales bacterium]|nr:hypothetical protein [Bacteroidales bacterium]